MIEIITKNTPYPNMDKMEVAIAVTTENYTHPIPTNCPIGLDQILKKCWAFDPNGTQKRLKKKNLLQKYPLES